MNQSQFSPSNSTIKGKRPAFNRSGLPEVLLKRARASLRQALTRHSLYHAQLQPELQDELNLLMAVRDKLDQSLFRIAVFGLVSRGKSAVLNALVGQKVFQTGPLNGVTQWPRAVRWAPVAESKMGSTKIQIELIDTPGLDEIEGQVRAQMARDVIQQADLILFVVSGDLTRTEYQALADLKEARKPLLLVFNKMDLYPDRNRQAIYQSLQDQGLRLLVSPREIVMTAAEPAPVQVRVEWPNGQVGYEWETPPPQVDQLKQELLQLLNREGQLILILSALTQAKEAEVAIAKKVIHLREAQAQSLISRFTRYKALAVALNPVALLDVVGGAITDLILIRALAKLYGLPITQFEANKLWRTIFLSSGGLALSELCSSLFFSLSKGTAVSTGGLGGVSTYLGAAATQAGVAGYGNYLVGHTTQAYLAQGCTWGSLGVDTVIQEIIDHLEPDTILYRIQGKLQN